MKQIVYVLTICAVSALLGCDGTPTGKTEPADYTLFGLAEINLESGAEYLYLEFLKESAPIPGSFARIGNDTLHFDANGMINQGVPAGTWQYNTNLVITVYDTAAAYTHTLTERMPGDVTVINFVPTTHIYQGGNVVVEWAGSPAASGVLVTCLPRLSNSAAPGFAANYGVGVSTATIGPEAFINPYSGERVADSFFVYVTLYNPSFESRPGAAYTAFEQMDNLSFPNSVSGNNIAGIFGAAVVSPREILEVVAQD